MAAAMALRRETAAVWHQSPALASLLSQVIDLSADLHAHGAP